MPAAAARAVTPVPLATTGELFSLLITLSPAIPLPRLILQVNYAYFQLLLLFWLPQLSDRAYSSRYDRPSPRVSTLAMIDYDCLRFSLCSFLLGESCR